MRAKHFLSIALYAVVVSTMALLLALTYPSSQPTADIAFANGPGATVTPTPTLRPTTTAEDTYRLFYPLLVHVPPGAPTAPTLAIIVDQGSRVARLTWQGGEKAQAYRVWHSRVATMASAEVIYTAQGSDASYTTQPLLIGANYFQVEALNAWGTTLSNISVAVIEPSLSLVVPAARDATVLQFAPDDNFGDTEDMWAGCETCYGIGVSRSLVGFDLSGLPADAWIEQALLSVDLVDICDAGQGPHPILARRASGAWDEMGVTWNSQPPMAEPYGAITISSGAWGRYKLDVTEWLRGWRRGSFANQGLWVLGPEASGANAARLGFGTREAGAAHAPLLEITYRSASR